MEAFCVCQYDYMPYAYKLLKGTKRIDFMLPKYRGQRLDLVRKEIERADIFLVIIDKSFNENDYLRKELRYALDSIIGSDNKILIPIVTENAEIPDELKKYMCLSCDFSSDKEVESVSRTVNSIIETVYRTERKKRVLHNNSLYMMLMTMIIGTFAMLFLYLTLESGVLKNNYSEDFSEIMLVVLVLIISLSMLTFFTSYLSVMQRRWQENRSRELETYSERLKSAIIPIEEEERECDSEDEKKKEIDALGRMMINLEDIKEFYTWSQKQAKSSFVLAVCICIIGVMLMVFACLAMIFFKLSLEVSIIVAIGGAITEVVAGTALVVYRSSLTQLNHYHRALHEDERFLSSVNLVGRFNSIENQDEMLKEIIRSEIEMNLLGVKKAEQNMGSKKKEAD